MLDLSKYPFLVVHPDPRPGIAVHLTDTTDLTLFVEKWHKQSDQFHKYFGYDLPTVWDSNCATITDFRNVKASDVFVKEVREMTFSEWMGLVEDAILRNE